MLRPYGRSQPATSGADDELPQRYRPREVITVLEHLGWTSVRQRGDHVRLVKEGDGNPVTVPVSRRELSAGLFHDILREAGITSAQFEEAAEEVL